MNQNPKFYYFYSTNIDLFQDIKKTYPQAKAIWTDDSIDLFESLLPLNKCDRVWIEEGLPVLADALNCHAEQVIKFEKQGPGNRDLGKLCALPSNDTHIHMMKPLLREIPRIDFLLHRFKEEGTGAILSRDGSLVAKDRIEIDEYAGLLLGMDWDTFELCTLLDFHKKHKPVFCLQESVLNFGDCSRRMELSDFALIQGAATIANLPRSTYALTGNPRYEAIRYLPRPNTHLALINCNFTYRVGEKFRELWISTAVEACLKARIPYLIVQHPRDTMELAAFNHIRSDPGSIHQLMAKSTVLISRFSSLIHESMLMGRPAVYFNPHGEKLGYQFECNDSFLRLSKDRAALTTALFDAQSTEMDPTKNIVLRRYINRHCGSLDGLPSKRVAKAIKLAIENKWALPSNLTRTRALRARIALIKREVLKRVRSVAKSV